MYLTQRPCRRQFARSYYSEQPVRKYRKSGLCRGNQSQTSADDLSCSNLEHVPQVLYAWTVTPSLESSARRGARCGLSSCSSYKYVAVLENGITIGPRFAYTTAHSRPACAGHGRGGPARQGGFFMRGAEW